MFILDARFRKDDLSPLSSCPTPIGHPFPLSSCPTPIGRPFPLPSCPTPIGRPFPLPSCPTPIGHPGQRVLILVGCQGKEKRYSCFLRMTAGVRCRWWVLSRVGMSLVSKKRNMFFLDARLRKDDHRGCISVRDFSLPSPLGLARGSRAKIPYFGGTLRGRKSGIRFPGCSHSQA